MQPRAIVEAVATGQRRRLHWVAALGLLGGCGAAPAEAADEPYVLHLEARSAGSFGGRGQSAWIDDVVVEGLAHARWFRASGAGPELPGRLRFEERTTADGTPVLHVHLVIEPDPRLASELRAGEQLEAFVELERRDGTIELRRDLPVAVERALALVDAKLTVVRGSVEDLEQLLRDEDPEVVLTALEGVERRRVRALDGAVSALLEHPQDRVALRAMECLGVIGGPEHAPGLLRVARLADRAHANRVYEALANLGGEYARGFLAFAARNEDDPELASLAAQALGRLDATEPAGSGEGVERGHRQ